MEAPPCSTFSSVPPGPVPAVPGLLEGAVEGRHRLAGVPDLRAVVPGVGVVAGGAADLTNVRPKDRANQLIGRRVA